MAERAMLKSPRCSRVHSARFSIQPVFSFRFSRFEFPSDFEIRISDFPRQRPWPLAISRSRGQNADHQMMKRIEAIVRPSRLGAVLEALAKAGVTGITVTETVGFGQQIGHSEVYTEIYKGTAQVVGLVPKRLLTLYLEDDQVDAVVQCLTETARTGKHGDGKIAVSNLETVVRIRTGEKGRKAL
jgi:nitrogen regulatory protein PII